jgi:hypothetical protein
MKTIFIVVALLTCGLCAGQKKSAGYFSIDLGINIPTVANADPILGGHFSGNGQIGKGGYAGIEVGV